MKIKCFTIALFFLSLILNNAFPQQKQLTSQEKTAVLKAFEEDSLFASWVENISNAEELYRLYKANVGYSDSLWSSDQQRLKKIKNFGSTKKFELVPLIENLHGNPDFRKGYGISYLIRTDNSTILFDAGWDQDSAVCAFRYNLDVLGIDFSSIDAIVISHNHGDHQNQWKWIDNNTFVNAKNENILPKMNIYIPVDTLELNINTICSYDPVKISDGVYTTGIIKAPLFFYPTQEQALIFNVENKGLILVTGCGHQGLEKLLQRSKKLSDIKLYGILGGLHFPLDDDSEKYMGYFIAGKLPWEKFTLKNVGQKIDLLKKEQPGIIGISTHDSSDKSVQAFKNAFGEAYKDLKTAGWIIVE